MISTADAILASAASGDYAALLTLRLAFSKQISAHVTTEIGLINEQLNLVDRVVDKDKDTLITRYHQELMTWRQALSDCNAQWCPGRIKSDPDGFCRVFGGLRDALVARVDWEEQVFYPRVLLSSSLKEPETLDQRTPHAV